MATALRLTYHLYQKKRRVIATVILFVLMACFSKHINAQSPGKKFKTGLALSGGGAKGLAYIGLLKMIDSLGIQVDYVSGTSMGGVLGGLYAMGYSGKQLEDIVMHVEWSRVLSNKVPLDEINIEEKDEYGQYMAELPVYRGKPGLPGAVIEGQYLSEVLNTYTFPARNINDFSLLPIPVHITTSDIVNGGTVIQTKGSLPLAIRATMAIPAVFSDVHIDGKLLVDGGLDRNFPVDDVKQMGADFVIGGYTGFHILTEKELESPFKMIMQTYAFNSVKDSKEQMNKTNLLLDYTTALSNYSSSDFGSFKQIIQLGEAAAQQKLPELVQLAAEQKKHGIVYHHELVKESFTPTAQYNFLNERNEPITDADEINMLHHLWQLAPGKYYPVEEVNRNIQRLFGTRFYDKVYYTYAATSRGLEMNIHLKKGKKGRFKAAMHYDTDQAAGILLNYTYYNVLFNRSRLLVTIDAAERLKARMNYYKFISQNNKLWLKPSVEYRNLKSNDFLLAITSSADVDNPPPDYFNRNISAAFNLGYSLNTKAFVEAGAAYEFESIHKAKNFFSRLLGEGAENRIYRHHNLSAYIRLQQNSLDAPYYATKGNHLQLEAKYSFAHTLKINNRQNTDSSFGAIYDYINPSSDLYNPKGEPGNIARFTIKNRTALPVSSKLSLLIYALAGMNSSSKFGVDNNTYFYLNNNFGIGGQDMKENFSSVNFTGLKQAEIPQTGFTVINIAPQYNPFKNLYISPTFSYGCENINYNIAQNLFKKDYRWTGYGLQLGYLSVIGPVDFSISKANAGLGLDFPWRAYFSFGYKF